MKILVLLTVLLAFSSVRGLYFEDYSVAHRINTFTNTSLLYYGDSGVTNDHLVLGTPSTPFSTGLVLHPTKVPAHAGFFLKASWRSSQCEAANTTNTELGADGFALIFLKDLPMNEQVQASVGTLGIGHVPNAYVFGYSSSYNEFYVCQWNEAPSINETPGALRNYCQTFPSPETTLSCGLWYFDVTFANGFVDLQIDGQSMVFSIPFVMDPSVKYYFGMSFGNDNYYRKQELLELLYYHIDTATEFNLLTANLTKDLSFCGNAASLDGSSIKLINSGQLNYGAATLNAVVYPNNGFVTKFTWTPSECDPFGMGGEGFSFFFAKALKSCGGGAGFALGVAQLPNVHAFLYESRMNTFLICDWEGKRTPIWGFVFDVNQICVAINNFPRLTCGTTYNFVLYYVNSTLNVFVDNAPLMAARMNFKADGIYVPGFSASSETMYYFRQDISNWRFNTDLTSVNLTDFIPPSVTFPVIVAPPPVVPPVTFVPPVAPPIIRQIIPPTAAPFTFVLPVAPPIMPHIIPPAAEPPVSEPIQAPSPEQCPSQTAAPSLVFLSNAKRVGNSLRLTEQSSPGGSGLVYRAQPLQVEDRDVFVSKFTWTPTNCDSVYDGADGWTFFLTKNVPSLAQVQSSTGGQLGIQNVPNTVMVAYSATFNEFWIANWTVPYAGNLRWESVRGVISRPKYTCGGSFNFSIIYAEPIIQIRLNNQVMVSAPIALSPVPYYFGLSGATGGGYFQQDFTNWTFTLPYSLV